MRRFTYPPGPIVSRRVDAALGRTGGAGEIPPLTAWYLGASSLTSLGGCPRPEPSSRPCERDTQTRNRLFTSPTTTPSHSPRP